jgi:hypothetical protein
MSQHILRGSPKRRAPQSLTEKGASDSSQL